MWTAGVSEWVAKSVISTLSKPWKIKPGYSCQRKKIIAKKITSRYGLRIRNEIPFLAPWSLGAAPLEGSNDRGTVFPLNKINFLPKARKYGKRKGRIMLISKRKSDFFVGLCFIFAVSMLSPSFIEAQERKNSDVKFVEATVFAKVAETFPGPYGDVAVVESPVFGPDGKLYFTNVFAGPKQAKIARIDLASKEIEELYKDDHSVLAAIQFSPHNGNPYVVDYGSGAVSRFDLAAKKLETAFDGMIGEYRAKSDDIAFDKKGFMYVSDEHGTLDNPNGKLFRLDQEGRNPVVLYDKFAGGNGIAFAPDYSVLWLSEYRRSAINLVSLSEDGSKATDVAVGIHVGTGKGLLDSIATDSAGNIYQTVWDAGRIMVYSQIGDLIGIIQTKDDFPKGSQLLVTNLAIRTGSTEAYMIVGGKNGGYIYKFEALAPGGPQSNGG